MGERRKAKMLSVKQLFYVSNFLRFSKIKSDWKLSLISSVWMIVFVHYCGSQRTVCNTVFFNMTRLLTRKRTHRRSAKVPVHSTDYSGSHSEYVASRQAFTRFIWSVLHMALSHFQLSAARILHRRTGTLRSCTYRSKKRNEHTQIVKEIISVCSKVLPT